MNDMKKRSLFLLLLLLLATATQAQLSNNQRLLGYTTTDQIDISGAAFGQAGTYTIGACLESDILKSYAGCKVVGVRFASALPLGRTRAFLYNIGDTYQEVLSQRQRIYEGWNMVTFNGTGYEIKGDETLFFGFDYVETDEMVSADQGALCCVGNDKTGSFYLYGNYNQGLALYPITGAGMLCVQLVVDVSTLPAHDMDVVYLDAGFKHKQPGDSLEMLATFRNVGRDSVFAYQVGYQFDANTPVYLNYNDTLPGGAQISNIINTALPFDMPIGMHRLHMFVSQINGQPVSAQDTDTLSASFAVYQQSLQRSQVYLEIYSDQSSAYVPYLDQAVNNLVSANNKVAVVNVHRPGTSLAIPEAAYLHSLYAYTWPTFTANRAYFPGENYVAYDMNDYLLAFTTDMVAGVLGDIVMQDYYSPSFATVKLTGNYDAATRQLTVEAKGTLLPEAQAIYGDMALTLLLTEDGVTAKQAVYNSRTGSTSYNNNYVHNQVLRGYLTAPTGSLISSVGNSFEVSFTNTLSSNWNPEKMHVVALLTKYKEEVSDADLLDMDVINTNSLALQPIVSSVQQPAGVTVSTVRYFTLDGKPVDSLHLKPGVYIERRNDGNVHKVLIR